MNLAFPHIKENLYGQSLSPKTFTIFCWSSLLLSFSAHSWVSISLYSLCGAFQEGRCLCNNENQIRRDQYLALRRTTILAVRLTTSSKGCILGNKFRKHVPQVKLG